MILSHKHRFIFIKTTKTAGTSVEIALSQFCGPEDIITPITPEDELTRAERDGPGPQNFADDHDPDELLFYNHMGAERIRELVGHEVWSRYYKFCIERNPWERVISMYYFRNRGELRPPLADFIESGQIARLRTLGSGLYTIDDEVVVDRVLRFESLVDDLEEVRLKLGLPLPLDLPRAKSRFRPDRRSYRELLSESDIGRIAEVFRHEIENLGYSP